MFLTDHLTRRYQVFVSSTFKDLIKDREEIRNALNRSNYIVEGMETFPAANKGQWEIIRSRLSKSDIYVLIIGEKYGTIAINAKELEPDLVYDEEPISYTRLEFRLAKQLKIPVLAFIKRSKPGSKAGTTDAGVKEFIHEVQNSNLTTDYWNNRTNLITDILRSLQETITNDDFIKNSGWVKVASLAQPIDPGNDTVYMINKVQYSKFISYSDKKTHQKPLYKKKLLRWAEDNERKDEEYDVYDEYINLTVTQLSHYVSKFQHYCRTDGSALDFASFLPFLNKFEFTDLNAAWNDKLFTPTIPIASNTYVHTTSYINGFQDGNMDMAVKANKFCENLMLFVDFTSIPNFEDKFRLRRCVKLTKGHETILAFDNPLEGIYATRYENASADTVLKFYFEKQ